MFEFGVMRCQPLRRALYRFNLGFSLKAVRIRLLM
nr:acetyltransferase [Vibrio navarrensis]